MELPPNNSACGLSNGVPEEEKNAWNVRFRPKPPHGSSDISLFSSSLPVMSHMKLDFSESVNGFQAFDDSFPSLQKLKVAEKVKDPLEYIEPSMVGTFLPGDEDELLAGLMDDFDLSDLPTQIEDMDDDLFGSGCGMEIEPENHDYENPGLAHFGFTNGAGTVSGEHPLGEHPSRTLFVRNINSNVEDSELKTLFEQYGDIRGLYTACKHRGFVMISYYDIRAARTAMRALQNRPLRRRKLDIHFSIPKDNPSEKDVNQGTLVAFNLDPSVSNDDLRQIFGAYGEVKEIRETPHKRFHKFIEYYDVRAAEAALKALNRSDIAGKRIKLEPSRPGGARRSLIQQLSLDQEQDEARVFRQPVGSPIANSPPGSWPSFGSPVDPNSLHGYSQSPNFRGFGGVGSNSLSGLTSVLSSQASSPVKIAPIGKESARSGFVNPVTPAVGTVHGSVFQRQFSVPDNKLSSSPELMSSFSDSKSSSVGTISGHQFLWGSPAVNTDQISSSARSSPLKAPPFLSRQPGFGFPNTSHHSSLLGSRHVGSAPSGVPLERHFGFFPESPETSYITQDAFGMSNFGHSNGSWGLPVGVPGSVNMGVAFAGENGSRVMPVTRNSPLYFGNGSFSGMAATMNDSRIRRGDSGGQMDNKKQFQLELEKIVNGEDNRTTLMIKNIPNKYTPKMLLAAIDETHMGAIDFLYLPIDFKNKCNVGYAFINMVSPSHIITFHEAFNGKKWEKFNSEKVASLAYARIQGRAALVSHFQNSSLMNEDRRCRPILFLSEGEEATDLETHCSGNLNVFIRRPDGSYYAGDCLDSPKSDSGEKL